MRIGLLETEHFEGAYPVIRLFDLPGKQLTIYTSAATQQRFADLFGNDTKRYQWHILATNSKLRFFYSLYQQLRKDKPDILYLNTISDNHLLYALVVWLLPLKRVILTVHDINCLFESRFAWNFRQAVIHFGKRWLIRQTSEFNVVAASLVTYLQTKTKKPIHNIPGAVYETTGTTHPLTEPVRIVIPGSLDKKRRDYQQALALAALADKEKLALQLVFLGGHADEYGEEILQQVQKIVSPYCTIKTYGVRIVDQHEFDEQMNAAHFVFIPSVIHTKICGNIPEVYGQTKSSGNLFDIIKHAKPFIIPRGLVVDDRLLQSCFTYAEPGEIISFLSAMVKNTAAYDSLQQKALQASEEYTVQKIRNRNAGVFLID